MIPFIIQFRDKETVENTRAIKKHCDRKDAIENGKMLASRFLERTDFYDIKVTDENPKWLRLELGSSAFFDSQSATEQFIFFNSVKILNRAEQYDYENNILIASSLDDESVFHMEKAFNRYPYKAAIIHSKKTPYHAIYSNSNVLERVKVILTENNIYSIRTGCGHLSCNGKLVIVEDGVRIDINKILSILKEAIDYKN